MKTVMATKQNIEKQWYLVDAENKVLGRLASEIAAVLRGKKKPSFVPHEDTGDFVVVVNAEKIAMTGKKLTDKVYYSHSFYPGGLKAATPKELLEKAPEKILTFAVKGMLPKNRLGRQMIKKLKVYAGTEHPHEAQKPEKIELV
ncbi:MAG: 50S ribosomal protein L13 [Nitrospirota bacterium]|nr:50S ribosomal protein L13 [Nitrospirota bacterium]